MTSQEIIRKAVRIVAEDGYDRLTLSSLAQELGVSKAGIYHHFSSKEEIIDAIYTHYEADMLHLGFSVDFSRPADEVLSTALSHWRSIFTSPERSLFISMVEQRRDVDETSSSTSTRGRTQTSSSWPSSSPLRSTKAWRMEAWIWTTSQGARSQVCVDSRMATAYLLMLWSGKRTGRRQ